MMLSVKLSRSKYQSIKAADFNVSYVLTVRDTLEQKAIRAGTSLSGPLGSSLCACLVNKDSIALLCLLITVHGK